MTQFVKQYHHIRMKFAFRDLVEFLTDFGWICTEDKNLDFPYDTLCWVLTPNADDHKNSDYIKKFLYACDYFDIFIDYDKKQILVYV